MNEEEAKRLFGIAFMLEEMSKRELDEERAEKLFNEAMFLYGLSRRH